MASGVGVDDEVVTKFQELKLGHQYRYLTFKLSSDNTKVVLDEVGQPSAKYDEFRAKLPATDCRYAIFDLEFDVEGAKRNKILFILWAPDSAKIKSKMLYTSSKADLKKKLVGIGSEIQATDSSEIDYETILDKAQRETRQ
eukprot:TRINITY_DN136299_c0_g1_i1.p1 TRINITY_DN136299_c0_g1~~TRINITY_DN136299_c0_g1_i1.p1  ORF type:complete len:141 (+),score=65.52 TRINITY_DN136299_c0_g1_i1:84-506(+)